MGINPSSVLHHWLWLLGVSFHFLQHPYNQDFNDAFSFLATKFASADMQFSVSASTSRWNQRWCHCTFQNNLSSFSLRYSREGLPLVDTRTSWRPLQFVDWTLHLLVWTHHFREAPNHLWTQCWFSVVENQAPKPSSSLLCGGRERGSPQCPSPFSVKWNCQLRKQTTPIDGLL